MRLKRTEVELEVDNFKFRYRWIARHKEFVYEVKEGHLWRIMYGYNSLDELPKVIQDRFTK